MPKLVDESKIFEAAIAILMSLGYDRATTRELAEKAGVNEVTLFRRYGNKARLFEQAIEHALADTPLTRLRFTGDLEADLLSIVDAYLETNELHGDIIAVILLEVPRNPELREALNTPMKNIRGIVEILQAYQRQGALRREPPLAALSALVGPIMINQMFRRAALDLPIPPVDARAQVSAFLDGRSRRR